MSDELLDITDEERAEAAELARALEKPDLVRAGSDAAFALALKASHAPPVAPDPAIEARAIERALDGAARKQRRRTLGPLLLAAAVLLVAVPAVGTLNRLVTTPHDVPTRAGLPTADALLGTPIDEDQPASERASALTRARTRSYFDARIARERGAR